MDIFDPIARPFGALMMMLYTFINDYGLSIILLAIIIKGVLLPFQMKSKRGMMKQTRLQPKIAELQKKHGTNKTKINEEMMKLYKEEGVNPASGCLWGLIPMPIMIAIFQVIRKPITNMMGLDGDLINAAYTEIGAPAAQNEFYAQISQSQNISNMGTDEFIRQVGEQLPWVEEQASAAFSQQIANSEMTLVEASGNWMDAFSAVAEGLRNIEFSFLGLDLSIVPDWQFLWSDSGVYASWIAGFLLFLLPLISGGSQFLSMRINRKFNPTPASPDGKGKGMQTVLMLMPLFSVYIGFITPGALAFYWTVSTVLQTGQDLWLNKVYKKKLDAEEEVRDAERKKKEAELEEKRIESERKKAEGLAHQNRSTSKRKKQKSSKQEQLGKAAEWEKKNRPVDEAKAEKHEPGRVGNRRYARGRAYDPDRYAKSDENAADDEAEDIAGISEHDIQSVSDSNTDTEEYIEDEEYGENSEDEDGDEYDDEGEYDEDEDEEYDEDDDEDYDEDDDEDDDDDDEDEDDDEEYDEG